MTGVTVRYWAGARQAAGVPEEPVPGADLAEVLAEVRQRHGAALGRVLDVCSFVVGDRPVGTRAHADVALAEGDVVEVLPPFAGGAEPVAAPSTPVAARWPVVGLAVLAGLLLAVGAASGEAAVWLVAVVLQLPLVAGWHRALGVSAPTGGLVVGAVVAVVADATVWLVDDDAGLAPLAAVLGATFLLGVVQQLARRDDRSGLTASLAATTSLGALVTMLAAWPVLLRMADGDAVVAAAGMALAAASLARLVAALPVAAAMVPGLGFVSGLVAGGLVDGVTVPVGAVLGVVVALPVLLADLLDRRDPRLTVVAWPAAAVWPFALAAPLAYVVARVAAA